MTNKLTSTILYLTLVLALLLSGCTGVAAASTPTAESIDAAQSPLDSVTAEGRLLPAATVELAFVQPGVVAEVLARPGEQISGGQVIARLVGSELVAAELEAARLEQLMAQQALDVLHENALLATAQAQQALQDARQAYLSAANGWRLDDRDAASDFELALDDYIQAEKEQRAAQDNLQRLKDDNAGETKIAKAEEDLDDESKELEEAYHALIAAVPDDRQPLEAQQTLLLQTIAALELARLHASELLAGDAQAGIDPDRLALADAQLKTAAAHVTAAESAQANYLLRAPFSGVLLSLDLSAGEAVLPGLPVAYLADLSAWLVETTDLAEIYIADISLGAPVTVKLDAFPDETFSARVAAIDPVGREHLGDITYRVTITLDEVDARFKWNMTATATIQAK